MRTLGLIIALLLVSCSSKHDYSVHTIDFGQDIAVSIDSLKSDSLLNPISMVVIDDTLIIANERTKCIFEKISIKDFTNLGSFGRFGAGPGEYNRPRLDALYQYGDGFLAMKEGSGEYMDIIEPNNLTVIELRNQTLPKTWQFFQNIAPIDENLSLAQNGTVLEWAIIDRKGNIKHTFPVEVPAKITNLAESDFARILVKTSNAVVSPNKDVVAIAYMGFPVVEFYDMDGALIGKIEGDISSIDKLERRMYGIYPVKDGLYIAYRSPIDKNPEQSTLIYTDWAANVKSIYTIPKKVMTFAVDEKNSRIFFSTPGNEDYLYYHKTKQHDKNIEIE